MDTLQDRPYCATWSRVSKRWDEPAEAQWGFKRGWTLQSACRWAGLHVLHPAGMKNKSKKWVKKTTAMLFQSKKKKKEKRKSGYVFLISFWQGESAARWSPSAAAWVSDWMCSSARVSRSWQQLNAAWQASLAAEAAPPLLLRASNKALVVVVALLHSC